MWSGGLAHGGLHQQAGWASTLPWLYYSETATAVRSDTSVQMKVSFKAPTTTSSTTGSSSSSSSDTAYDQMSFKLAKYALNGTWLGMEDLSTQLMFCGMQVPFTDEGAGSSSNTRWLQFGHNTKQTYQCDLTLLMQEETFFYDLYMVDQVREESTRGSLE